MARAASRKHQGADVCCELRINERTLERWISAGLWPAAEIARLDHSFERGLTDVTAEYGRGERGTVRVTNRGYDPRKGSWRSVEGVGKPAGDANVGSLKVKVGAPFFTGYHVIALDQDAYAYAMVCGPTRDYLWLLSRTPSLPEGVQERLVAEAASLGLKTDELVYVTHDRGQTRPAAGAFDGR